MVKNPSHALPLVPLLALWFIAACGLAVEPGTVDPRDSTAICPSAEDFHAEAMMGYSTLRWSMPESAGLEGYFLYRYDPEDPGACLAAFRRRYHCQIHYGDTDNDGSPDPYYSEPLGASERWCYTIAPLCYSDAYRGPESAERCVCGDLQAFYSREILYPLWESSSTPELYTVDSHVPPNQRPINMLCTDRTIIHNDEWTWPTTGPRPLHPFSSLWSSRYVKTDHSELMTKDIPWDSAEGGTNRGILGTYALTAQMNVADQYRWSGEFSYTATGRMTHGQTCSTTFTALAPPLYRTPEAELVPLQGAPAAARNGEWWGCSVCEPVVIRSQSPNYTGIVPRPERLLYQWKINGGLYENPDPEQPDIFSTGYGTPHSAAGYYEIMNRNSLLIVHGVLNRLFCHSDLAGPVHARIYESPAAPRVDGPISICKSPDPDAAVTTLTAAKPDHTAYHGVQWFECLDPYGECYHPSPPECFDGEAWDLRAMSPEYTVTQPAGTIKQKQLYIRGNDLMGGTADRRCYGQQFLTLHYKEQCRTPDVWTNGGKAFFPATSAVQRPGPLNGGRAADAPAIVHSNLLKGAFALRDAHKLTLPPGEYRLSLYVRTSGSPTGTGRIMAYIDEYGPGSSTSVPLPPLPLEPTDVVADGWREYAGLFTPAIAHQILFSIGIEYFSGWVALDDIALVQTGSPTNLLIGYDPGFEGTTYWTDGVPDPFYPGTAFQITDGGEEGKPTPPRQGHYRCFHNLAGGGIASGSIAVRAVQGEGVRVGFEYRGQDFSAPDIPAAARIYVRVDFLNQGSPVGDPQILHLPLADRVAWGSAANLDCYPSTGGRFTALVLRVGVLHLDGWIAFDNLTLGVIDAAGSPRGEIAMTNAGFESGSCDGSGCTLTGWMREAAPGHEAATAVFHPAFFPEFAPLSVYQPWGPVASDRQGGKFAVSVSNQMWGVSDLPAPLAVTETAEYEVSLWVRGTLLHQSEPDPYLVFALLRMDSDGGGTHSGHYEQITPLTLTPEWRQHRFTVVAEAGAMVQIRLMTPYLSGWIAFDEVEFGLWNRPPRATVRDTRYIPNQEEQPTLFAGAPTAYPGVFLDALDVSDPDSSTDTVRTEWKLDLADGTGDHRFTASSRIDTPPDQPLVGRLRILDAAGAPAHLDLNQETGFSYVLRVQDGHNPELFTEEAAAVTVEPFYALNPNFEATITPTDGRTPAYWQLAPDPGFPATGTTLYGESSAPTLTGGRSILMHNLATGYIASKAFYPENAVAPLAAGPYVVSVAAKGILRTGWAVVRVTYFDQARQPLSAHYPPVEARFAIGDTWARPEAWFTLEDASGGAPAVWHLKFEIGIEQADGWAIFDDVRLTDPTGRELLDDYDPSFNGTAFWNYRADNIAEYPNTATLHYAYNILHNDPYARFPWMGGPPTGGHTNTHGVVKGNFMSGGAGYNIPIRMTGTAAVSAKVKWDLMDYPDESGVRHRGRAVLWISLWDGRPALIPTESAGGRATARVVSSIPVPVALDRDTATAWTSILQVVNKPAGVSDPYLTFFLETDMLYGWLALDDVRVVMGNRNWVGQGSFEYGSATHWRLLPRTAGTGIFADSRNLFTPAALGGGYLVFTQLAYGWVQTPRQDIAPGVDYALSLFHRGQDLGNASEWASKVRMDYYQNNGIIASAAADLVPADAGGAAFSLHQGVLRHPADGGFTGTERMQLKLGVEKLAGWLQLDALILKPVSPAPFQPDPAVNAAGVVCEDQFLRTVRGKDAYQWYFNNRAEGMSTEARQVAFSPGNYAVAYTEPDTGVHALGFAVPVQVTAVPEMWIWVNRIWCIPQQYYLAVAGQKITMWGVSVDMAPVDSWHWDFGDGETAIDQFAVSHVYPQPGIYGVTLTVSQGGCVGRATATICVGSGPPYAGCPCTIQPAYDADADETLETEAILTAYAEGDDYDQTALRGLVADQTVAGQARKQNIHDKPTRVAMTETLLFSLPEELFAQYEADGERITRGELQKALYSAAKIREKDREQTGGAQ